MTTNARSEAARLMGQVRSERKTEAARRNAPLGGRPKVKTPLGPTLHRDGTVTYWSVYDQEWLPRQRAVPDAELAAMSQAERERVRRHTQEAR